MSYKKIYEIIYASENTRIRKEASWISRGRSLRISLENKRINKQIWLTRDHGQLEIATARLDLDGRNSDYYKSIRRYPCKNLTEMASRLKSILEGTEVT